MGLGAGDFLGSSESVVAIRGVDGDTIRCRRADSSANSQNAAFNLELF